MNKKQVVVETVEFYTAKNTVRTMYDKTDPVAGNAGQVAIIKADILVGQYHSPSYQLFRLKSGFGIRPDTSGNACFGHFCADGEQCRMERYDFIGIADEATTAYAEELESKWQNGKKVV